MTTQSLTRTEAETLAHLLHSAGHHMARARHRQPGTHTYTYVWDWTDDAYAEMLQGFYDIAPAGIYV